MNNVEKKLVKKVAKLVDDNMIDYACRVVATYCYINCNDEDEEKFSNYETKFAEYEAMDGKSMIQRYHRDFLRDAMYEDIKKFNKALVTALEAIL